MCFISKCHYFNAFLTHTNIRPVLKIVKLCKTWGHCLCLLQWFALHFVVGNPWNTFVATCIKMPMSFPPFFHPVMWEKLGKQLGHPTRSVAGWLVSRFLTARNQVLEENAVQLSGIRPGDTVLELGHGPGLGLQSAAKLLTEPTGRLIGVDYSEYMHQVKYEKSWENYSF